MALQGCADTAAVWAQQVHAQGCQDLPAQEDHACGEQGVAARRTRRRSACAAAHARLLLLQGLTLKRHIEATLGQGNIREAVRLPPGEDLNEWLAVNTVDFYNAVSTCQLLPSAEAGWLRHSARAGQHPVQHAGGVLHAQQLSSHDRRQQGALCAPAAGRPAQAMIYSRNGSLRLSRVQRGPSAR